MYTTKPLSQIKATPAVARQRPEEGSGYLVCGYRVSSTGLSVRDLPFPQNKVLEVRYVEENGYGGSSHTKKVLFVPVMNEALSRNRYYVVVAEGNCKGEIITCSKEEDKTTCCGLKLINDVDPKPFDHRDIYQQIQIISHNGRFTAESVAPDGYVPWIFRKKYWELYEKNTCQMHEAFGLNTTLSSHLPEPDVSEMCKVGTWYCPFFFVKEGNNLREQMGRSMFYLVTLELFWERISKRVQNKRILFEGREVMQQESRSLDDGFTWFKKRGGSNRERIGLSLSLFERLKREENRRGWIDDDGTIDETKFGSSVLVERFLFERVDGSLVFAMDFLNANKVITTNNNSTPVELDI